MLPSKIVDARLRGARLRRTSLATIVRRAALTLLVLPLAGCNFIQNEVFVFDLAPPAPAERPSGVDATW